jgi:hypothetical protein
MPIVKLGLALACLAIVQARAQEAVTEWFPLHPGDQWFYAHESRDNTGAGQAHPEIHQWRTKETVTGIWTIPEGTLVGKQVRVIEGSPRPGYRVDASPADLIRGNCAYTTYLDWDPIAHQLTAYYRQSLLAGEVAADFCFPLVVGKSWGAPHWADWRPPADAQDWRIVAFDASQNAFHIASISSYLGSGMTADIWFEKAVGIIREDEIHHGTVGEERTRLLHFVPASPR